jgi:hypothetical protein
MVKCEEEKDIPVIELLYLTCEAFGQENPGPTFEYPITRAQV